MFVLGCVPATACSPPVSVVALMAGRVRNVLLVLITAIPAPLTVAVWTGSASAIRDGEALAVRNRTAPVTTALVMESVLTVSVIHIKGLSSLNFSLFRT